jgi:hypothetical protein
MAGTLQRGRPSSHPSAHTRITDVDAAHQESCARRRLTSSVNQQKYLWQAPHRPRGAPMAARTRAGIVGVGVGSSRAEVG